MRSSLEAALISCADSAWKARARRFLRGLSCDELQYIASYLGACILDPAGAEEAAACAQHNAEDHQLKMILVMEYLGRAGNLGGLVPRRAG